MGAGADMLGPHHPNVLGYTPQGPDPRQPHQRHNQPHPTPEEDTEAQGNALVCAPPTSEAEWVSRPCSTSPPQTVSERSQTLKDTPLCLLRFITEFKKKKS